MRTMSRNYINDVTRSGSPFFTPEAMAFFDSRVEGDVYFTNDAHRSAFVVTSEQFDEQSPRLFTIRYIYRDNTGRYRVETLGEFQAYPNYTSALSEMANYMDALLDGDLTHEDILS